ncbi:MFS transporter [Corynebacterium diphtheriae]|uniref:MFS transporter n=1 Tax=Corynebacterium diphtheriae TaxID=1717 RepID=UPI0034D3E17E
MRSAIRLMVGQALVSRVSAAAELVALNWWVFHATGSSAMVGAVTLARLVPLAVAGPWLGARADRVEPTRLLAAVLSVGAVMTVLMACVMYVQGEGASIRGVWMVVVAVAVRAVVTSAEPAIRNATVAAMSGSGELMSAMASLSLVITLSLVVGPALAGVLMAAGGSALVVALCGAGYAAAVSSLALPRVSTPPAAAPSSSAATPWRTAIRVVGDHPRLGAQLVIAAGPMLCVFPYTAMMPVIAHTLFADDAQRGIAILSAAGGVGAVIGAVLMKKVLATPPAVLAVGAAIALTLPTVFLAVIAALPKMIILGAVCVCLLGFVGQLYRTSNRTATLLLAPDEHKGLFAGISQTDRVLIPAGAFLLGFVADHWGVVVMAAVMAVGNAVLILPALFLIARNKNVASSDVLD